MTNDELAQAFRANFEELHAKIAAMPDGHVKLRAHRLARISHGAMDELKDLALVEGEITVESGGDPKNE